MSLTKKDKEEIVELVKAVIMGMDEAATTWQPKETLDLEYDGGTKVALNPYWEIDENGEEKTKFTWDEVQKINEKLPDGWRVATRHDFIMTLEEIGRNEKDDIDGTLVGKTGWSGGYWSSTEYGSDYAYYLYVSSSRARVYYGRKPCTLTVVCIGS